MRPFLCSYQVRHLDLFIVDFSKKSASSCITLILFSARVQACSRSGVDRTLFFGLYRSVKGCGKVGSVATVVDDSAIAVLDDSPTVAVLDDVATVDVDNDSATVEILEEVGLLRM